MRTFILPLFAIVALTTSGLAQTVELPAENNTGQSQGPAIDRKGAPVVDPTRNVLDLVIAQGKRQDDLREANDRLVAEKIKRLDDMRDLIWKRNDELRTVENARYNDLRIAESRRVDEQAALHAAYQEKLNIAESNRINAIRAVDVGAVAVASERATQQATVLANQVTASADALRALVATTATTFATQQQLLQTQVTERLSALEKGSYQNTGRASVSDPQLEKLNALVERLATAQATGSGKSEGIGSTFGVLMGITGLVIAVGAIIMSRRKTL